MFTTREADFERGRHVLAATAASLGAKLEARLDAPGFRRYALDDARLPGEVDPRTLRAWLAELIRRLRRVALPDS